MFEQSVLQQEHTKPWTLGVSMTMQAAMIGSAVLLSIIHLQRLELAVPRNTLMAPPTPRIEEAVKLVPVPRGSGIGIARGPARPFVVPNRIPTGIPKIVDEPGSAPDIGFAHIVGSPDGVPYGNVITPPGTQIASPRAPAAPVPSPAATVPKAPVRVSQGVMEAMIIHRVIPIYPALAKSMRVQGKVHLMGIIGKDGTIQNLRVVDGHPLLVPAAVDAVKQWIYRPTLLSGEPVEVITPIEVNFTMTW